MFQSGPIHRWRRRVRCSNDWPVSGSITARDSGDHWLPCRTSEASHHCKNLEGNVWLEAAKGDTLRHERVRCAIGVGGLTVTCTSADGWCTLGDWRNIGDSGIVWCRSAKGRFCLNRTSRIERTYVLQFGAVVAGGGVARGVTTLGGGGNDAGGDTTAGGTNLAGSIAAVTGGGGGMGVGCFGCNLSKIRGVASSGIGGIGGIGQGSQFLKSSRRLVIAVSCSW